MIFSKDESGKTLAYKFKNNTNKITKKNIQFLLNISKKKREDVRILLHKSQNDKMQTMVNLLFRKKVYEFIFHRKSTEIYHILKGRLVIIYKNKNKKKKVILDNKKNYIFRMEKKVPHVTYPKDSFCIFHEIREGPFRKNDNYYTGERIVFK
jgi:cupin fold WbuC family metalloprotein